jgi:hypothetical protein
MKEIHHKDNEHLDAVNKIRVEAEELGFTSGYLGYGDAPICQKIGYRSVIVIHRADPVSVRKCDLRMPSGTRLLALTLSLQPAKWRQRRTTFFPRCPSSTCLLVMLRSTLHFVSWQQLS